MFPQQSTEAQRLLLVCAQNLKGNDKLISDFVRKQGGYFYQRDIENMSHYPPQYGLRAKHHGLSPAAVDGSDKTDDQPSEAQ